MTEKYWAPMNQHTTGLYQPQHLSVNLQVSGYYSYIDWKVDFGLKCPFVDCIIRKITPVAITITHIAFTSACIHSGMC